MSTTTNLVIGGGPAGSYLAYLLAQKGEKVDLYERNPRQDKQPKPCVTPDTPVVTRDGVRPIQDVRVGDYVLTHAGRFRKVLDVMVRDYEGDMVSITPTYYNQPVRLTPEHPVMVVRGSEGSHRKRGIGVETEYRWVPAGDVTERDYVVFPKARASGARGRVDLARCAGGAYDVGGDMLHNRYVQYAVRRNQTMDGDFYRLAGYYLSEGSAHVGVSSRLDFSFNALETDLVDDVRGLLREKYGVEPFTQVGDGGSCIRIGLRSKPVAEFFAREFGVGKDKHVPLRYLTDRGGGRVPQLLKGWILGDGNIREENGTPEIRVDTVSKQLAYAMAFASMNYGAIPSFRVMTEKPEGKGYETMGRKLVGSQTYQVAWHGKSAIKLADRLGIRAEWRDVRRRYMRGYSKRHTALIPVDSIERTRYAGKVYNLEVDEDNTYTLPYMTVHNCSGGVAKWWLNRTGVPVSDEFIGDTIRTVRILYGKETIWESTPSSEAGLILTRGKFERFLQKEAGDLGARVHYEARYDHFDEYDRVYLAEGASGQVKKRLGLSETRKADDFHLGVQLIGTGPVEPHTIEVYADDLLQGGYAWRFPHELGVEVGLGIPATHSSEAWPILNKWLDKMGWKVDAKVRQTHIIPTNYPQRQDFGKVMLLGDAAYLTSPISGGGIHAALFSAKRAAEGKTVGRKFALQSRLMYAARNRVIGMSPSRVAGLIRGMKGVSYDASESPYDKLVFVLKAMRKGLGLVF